MPRTHRQHTKKNYRIGIAEATLAGIFTWAALLIGGILVLSLSIAQDLWPAWLVQYRLTAIAILGLALLSSLFFAPIILEANTHPRHLSGAGHNPESGPGSNP